MTSLKGRILFAFALAALLSLPAAVVRSEGEPFIRLTHTAAECLNLNPSVSGDGRRVVFESNAALDATGAPTGFRAYAVEPSAAPSFALLAASRAPAPAVSQDGSRVAFAGKDDPLGRNADGNSEIFLSDRGRLTQLTDTRPDDPAQRAAHGCFQPSISDDGRLVAFTSNRDLTGANPDANPEIFLFDPETQKFTQLTDTTGANGATDAKISGDGSRVAFIREGGADAPRDLVLYERARGEATTALRAVAGLAFTHGRAVSDDGLRVVYSARGANNATQVFILDGRNDNHVRQLTSLGTRASDVPLHPTISGDGHRVAFATRRNVVGGNPDASVELYVHDIPAGVTTRVTSAPAVATAEVVSSLNDDGTVLAFNFPRALADHGAHEDFANNSEIFVAAVPPRPAFAHGLQILNGAALNRAPFPAGVVAPDSLAVANGARLALSLEEARRSADGTFPTRLQNVSVTVGGRAAQILYVSPAQVGFHLPAGVEAGAAEVAVRSADGLETRGVVSVQHAAPGIFTLSGGGAGEAVALDNLTLRPSPFDATDERGDPRRLIIFATGLRRATRVEVIVGGLSLKVEAVVPSPGLPGLDQIHVALSHHLKGAGTVPLLVRADGFESNRAALTLADGGAPPRAARLLLTPASAAIPVGGEARFRVSAFDANDEEIAAPQGVTFTSSDARVATIDAGGVAVARLPGVVEINAHSGVVAAAASLRVVERTLVINEVLADPPEGPAGDANHDGVRSGSDDEFVELVNASDAALNLGGWTLRTRSLNGASENVRHVFESNFELPRGEALVLFGGGSFDKDDPFFGGALVEQVSSGALSLTNGGLTVLVRDGAGNLVTQFTYGAGDGFGGDSVDQSLTRAPDLSGAFARHASANPARRFSPGVRLDGSFFLERRGRLTRLSLLPPSQTIFAGDAAHFTAQAFDHFGRPMQGVAVGFTSSDAGVAFVERVTADEATGVVNAFVRGHNVGAAQLTATAGDETNGATSATAHVIVAPRPPKVVRVEIDPSSLTLNRGGARQLTATAFDESGRPLTGATFDWASDNPRAATADASGFVRGVGVGAAVITATTSDGLGGTVAGRAHVNTRLPLVINELLADVPPDDASTAEPEGDANRDGVRAAADDEFVELVNNSPEPLDVSGVQLSDATAARFTFPAGSVLDAGRAVVIFGGGAPPADPTAFGGAFIVKANSLSLNDAGDTVTLKLPLSGETFTIASLAFGPNGETPAPRDQSLSRTPDAEADASGGGFAPHASIHAAAGRVFSPGTRADGTPFGSPALTRLEVTPHSATLEAGSTHTFSARAFARVGDAEAEVSLVSFVWDSADAFKASVSPSTGLSTTASAHASGTVSIRARAGGIEATAILNINPAPTPTPNPTPTPSPTPTPLPSPTPSTSPTPTPSPTPSPSPAPSAATHVRVSQIYGGGGNSGATLRNDFIELFNPGDRTVELAGWSVQYASAGGTAWQKTDLSGSIAPGGYYLVQQAGGSGGTQTLPTPDAVGTIALSATAGKVALVNNADTLNGNCPRSAAIVDFVGYGGSPGCFEGGGPAPAPSNTRAAVRNADGCADTGDNSTDFSAATPQPRNTHSPPHTCGGAASQTQMGLPLFNFKGALSRFRIFDFGFLIGE